MHVFYVVVFQTTVVFVVFFLDCELARIANGLFTPLTVVFNLCLPLLIPMDV